MSFKFVFNDGQGGEFAENDDVMDYEDELDPDQLEALSSFTDYLKAREIQEAASGFNSTTNVQQKEAPKEKASKVSGAIKPRAGDDIKAKAVHLVDIHPKNNASAVARELNLNPKSVQRWYKTWKEDPDSLFKTLGRPRIIDLEGEEAEQTKSAVQDFYYQHPTATIDQLMDHLASSFEDLSISKATVYRYMADLWVLTLKQVRLEPVERNTPERIESRKAWVEEIQTLGVDYMDNCVFIDESGFHANLNRTQGWAPKGDRANVKVLTARANTISILGAVSAKGVIKVCLRKPKPPSKKRKLQGGKKPTTGTTSSHFMNFIVQVLNEMDKFPEMKGHYLIMDNASIHKDKAIMELIEKRGYKYLYVPPYSPELNPIEQFWSVLKAYVKKKFDLKKDTLPKSIIEGAHNIPKQHFVGFAQYSIKRFEDCLAKRPI